MSRVKKKVSTAEAESLTEWPPIFTPAILILLLTSINVTSCARMKRQAENGSP